MTTPDIPLLDIAVWREGTARQRVFLEAEVDTVIRPVAGNRDIEPVIAGEWLRAREAAATVS